MLSDAEAALLALIPTVHELMPGLMTQAEAFADVPPWDEMLAALAQPPEPKPPERGE